MHPKLYDDGKQVEASLEFDNGDEELMLDVENYKSHGEHEEEANSKLVSRISKLIDELEKCRRIIEYRYTFAHCDNCKHGFPEKNGKHILCEFWFDHYGGIDTKEPSDNCYKWHAKEDY